MLRSIYDVWIGLDRVMMITTAIAQHVIIGRYTITTRLYRGLYRINVRGTYNVLIYTAYDVPRHQSFTKTSHVHYWSRRRVKFGRILYRWRTGRLSDLYQNPSRTTYLTFAISEFNVIVSSCILLLGIIIR